MDVVSVDMQPCMDALVLYSSKTWNFPIHGNCAINSLRINEKCKESQTENSDAL